jgi:predicted metal-binding protein
MKLLMETALAAGASNVGMAKVAEMQFSSEFKDACAQNVCGKYGMCWMCPPDVGDIHELISRAKQYENIMVFQTIGQLEDSFDFEGMEEAAVKHNELTLIIAEKIRGIKELNNSLLLGAGACNVCPRCTKPDSLPCAFPHKAIPSLEAYGVAVSELAKVSGLKYINGENTVTYFGGVLF